MHATLDPPRRSAYPSILGQLHRNRLGVWSKDPAFIRELHRRLDERDVETRLRRLHTTTTVGNRLTRLATSLLDAAEQDPGDKATQRAVSAWLAMWRRLANEERLMAR